MTPELSDAVTARASLEYATPADRQNRHAWAAVIAGTVAATIGVVGLLWPFTSINARTPVAVAIAAAALAVLALTYGVTGLRRSRDYRTAGRRSALIALLLGFVGCLTSAAIFLESGSRRYPHDPSIHCASNLRQIGLGILMYANEHGGRFPPTVNDILLTEDLTSEVFVCPASPDTRAVGPTTRAVAAALTAGGCLSYVYVGGGFSTATPATAVVAYERQAFHQGGGMNVLYADGKVQFHYARTANKILGELAQGHNPPRPEKLN